MASFVAAVPTAHASRYLQQLCKHWSHKFEVAFDPTNGRVRLPGADCVFVAEPQRLVLALRGDDAARLRDVVADHLKRFAFREAFEVTWSPADADADAGSASLTPRRTAGPAAA
jgi:hypothetical protein